MSAVISEISRLPLGRLRHLLGGNPTLMALPIGSKVPRKGSTHDLSVTDNEQTLSASNIAVRLGKEHGNICAIDFDGIETSPNSGEFIVNPDDMLERFFRFNPHLKYSLRTKGRRGASIWVRPDGDCRSTVKHLHIPHHKESVGELRFNQYSLIQGIHPDTRNPYKVLVDAPAFNVSLGDITWLDGRKLDAVLGEVLPLLHRNTQDVYTRYAPLNGRVHLVSSIISSYLPTAPHNTDEQHFNLARHIKTWERDTGINCTEEDIIMIGREWWNKSDKRFLKKRIGQDGYAVEFLGKYQRTKHCLGDGGKVFNLALKSAHEEDCHDKVASYFPQSKHVQIAANLCRGLAGASTDGSFFLSARKLQEALELPNAMAACRILKHLRATRVIKELNKGDWERKRASFYRYNLDDLNTEQAA